MQKATRTNHFYTMNWIIIAYVSESLALAIYVAYVAYDIYRETTEIERKLAELDKSFEEIRKDIQDWESIRKKTLEMIDAEIERLFILNF